MNRDILCLLCLTLLGVLLGWTTIPITEGPSDSNSASSFSLSSALERHSSHVANPDDDAARQAYHIPSEEFESTLARYVANERWKAASILLTRWGETHPIDAIEASLAIHWPEQGMQFRYHPNGQSFFHQSFILNPTPKIFDRWLQRDPDNAMATLLDYNAANRNVYSLTSALEPYAEKHPAKAYRLAKKHYSLEGPIKLSRFHMVGDSALLRTLFYQWAQTEPRAAFEEALTYSNRELQSELLGQIYRGWSNHDPQEVAAWAESLPANAPTKTLERERALKLAEVAPLSALPHFVHTPHGSFGRNLAEAYATKEGRLTFAALNQLTDPPTRRFFTAHAVATLADQMLGADLGEMVLELPADVQQPALEKLASHWKQDEPQAAQAFAQRIPHPLSRKVYERALDKPR